jgi:mannose-6-phosphate isomerase-like protein (cupin superfamily)
MQVHHIDSVAATRTAWGSLGWLINASLDPGAETTFGLALISPGSANTVHIHPNCEEVILILEGVGQHRVGNETCTLAPGVVLRVPRGVPHQAVNTGSTPMRLALFYSSADRQTIDE